MTPCIRLRTRAPTLLLPALALLAGIAGADSPRPAARIEHRGGITGVVPPACKLQAVIALEPYELKVYTARIEAGTGRFTFRGLPAGEYDLLIKTEGRCHEGITLDMEEDEDEDDGTARGAPSRALCREVRPFIMDTEDYFDLKQIVRVAGTDQRARAFVVQTRTKHVVDPGGTPIDARIRRFDLVDLVKTRKVWQIPTSRHLLRQEVPRRSKDIGIKLVHCPSLGGLLVGERTRDLGTLDLNKLPTSSHDGCPP